MDQVEPPNVYQTKWFRAGLFLLAAGAGVMVWSIVCSVPGVPWNPARLAPSFALARGLPIYQLRNSGEQLGWFYGPVFPLWYLPIGWMDQPVAALMLAAGWNLVTCLLPLAILVRRVNGARGGRLAADCLVAAVLLLGHAVTENNFYYVHVDVVCLAWGLTACLALQAAVETGRPGALHLAALAVALAVWTKQLAFMLYPALGCWLWFEAPRPVLGRFAFWSVVYGAMVSAAILGYFGAPEVLFNVVIFHARNSWEGGLPLLLGRVERIALASLVWLPAAALGLWLWRRAGSGALPSRSAAMVRLLLWAAAWQLPLGLLALLKTGGGDNSLHSLDYVFAAGLILLGQTFARPVRVPARGLAWAGLLALGLPVATAVAQARQKGMVWTAQRGQDQLLTLAREHPGRYYFPGNPLITIIAERREYPLDYALYCLWCARLEVPAEIVRATVPLHPIIIYQEPAQGHFALRYFPRQPAPPPH